MFVKQINFDDPIKFLNYFLPWNNDLRNYIYRGQSCADWKLIPKVLRDLPNRKLIANDPSFAVIEGVDDWSQPQILEEFSYLREFYRMADLQGLRVPHCQYIRDNLSLEADPKIFSIIEGTKEWIPNELNDIAGLAQHYGVPTRLLDWTYDPFVAIYFAVKEAINKTGTLSVWCLNKKLLTSHSIHCQNEIIRFITPPYYDNPNLKAQKGLFTLIPFWNAHSQKYPRGTPVDRRPLDEILEEKLCNMEGFESFYVFKKITLPCKLAIKVYLFLLDYGYGDARIYPGYKGIAEQLLNTSFLNPDDSLS